MFEVKTETVICGDHEIKLRGVSARDLSIIYSSRKEELKEAYEYFTQIEKGDVSDEEFNELGGEFVLKFASFAAFLIALAAEQPDNLEAIERMPFPSQVECLLSIYNLTIEDSGGLDNFLALAKTVSLGVNSVMIKGLPS